MMTNRATAARQSGFGSALFYSLGSCSHPDMLESAAKYWLQLDAVNRGLTMLFSEDLYFFFVKLEYWTNYFAGSVGVRDEAR